MEIRPKKGTKGTYTAHDGTQVAFEVVSVEGNLCYAKYENDPAAAPFIWKFKDGLNAMHDWPGKSQYLGAKALV